MASGKRCKWCNGLRPRHVQGCKAVTRANEVLAELGYPPVQRALELRDSLGCPHAIGTADVCDPCRRLLEVRR